MYCPKCGSWINDNVRICPYCGEIQPVKYCANRKYNLFSVLGFILSCVSILIILYTKWIAFAGIIISAIGYVLCKNRYEKGEGLAIGGIIVGVLQILLSYWLTISFLLL